MRKWIIDLIIFAALICCAGSYKAIADREISAPDIIAPAQSPSLPPSAGQESASILTKVFESSGIQPHAALLQVRVSTTNMPYPDELELISSKTGADIQLVPMNDGVQLYATLCTRAETTTIEYARECLIAALEPYGPPIMTIALTGVRQESDYQAVQKRIEQNLCAIEKSVYETDGLESRSLISPLLSTEAQVATRQRAEDVLVYIGIPVIPMDY